MVDNRLAIPTAMPAAPEIGVELLQHLRRHLRHRHRPESRLDRPADVAAVTVEGGFLGLVRPQPGVESLTERCAGPWAALVVDLCDQAFADPLGLAGVGCRLGEEHPLAREGIEAGVDRDLHGVSAPPDRPSLPSHPAGRHGCKRTSLRLSSTLIL
jgi:hypothetical protein